jgi:hypothetical protein
MTPCVARDGQLALSSSVLVPQVCIGCENTPEYLAEDLAEEYEPARELLTAGDPITLANVFAEMVREATEPGKEDP